MVSVEKKNNNCLLEIWKIFDSINDKLIQHGIIRNEIPEGKFFFNIRFDNLKINPNSLAIKHNITGVSISCKWMKFLNFCPEISLLNNGYFIKNFDKDGLKTSMFINPQFPVLGFLKKIFKIIGINYYDRSKDIFKIQKINMKIEKLIYDPEGYNIILENIKKYKFSIYNNIKIKKEIEINLQKYKKEFDDLLKIEKILNEELLQLNKLDDIIFLKNIYKIKTETLERLQNIFFKTDKSYNETELIKKYNNFLNSINIFLKNDIKFKNLYKIKNMKQKIKESLFIYSRKLCGINYFNIILDETFVLKTINIEKKLFPEIFNFEITKRKLPKNIIIYNNIYIELSTEIKNYLNKSFEFEKLEQEINNYLEYIYENFY